MKNKLFVAGIAVLVIVAIVLALLFVKCDGSGEKKNVDKVYLGGIISFGSQNQLFAKIAVGVPHSKSDYKAKIEGLPETLDISTSNSIRTAYYEIDFFVVSATSNMGEFPYKITVFNDKETHVFEGILIISKTSSTQDLVAGNAGKTGYLGNVNMSELAVVATVKTGKLMLANPVISKDFAIAGLSTGEVMGVDFKGQIKWKTQTTKNIIESLQIIGEKLITSDNSGLVSLFSVDSLAKGDKNPESTYRINGTLSAPPTILDDKTIILGTSDGLVLMLSVPGLDKIWEVKRPGAIMGPISAIPLGAEKGTLFFNCADNNTYIVGFDSQLVARLQNNQQTIGSPIAMTDRFAINSKPNQVQLRDTSGREKWFYFCNFDVTGTPLMTQDQVFAHGRTKISAVSMQDGTENWTVDMPSAINSNPVIAGNHILVPTEDKTVTILRTNDGLVTGTFKVDGSVIPWPCARDGRLVIADRIGNLLIFGKTNATLSKKFDMSKVVVNGGSGSISHNNVVKANFPTNPKLLWSKPGSFAPAISTIDRLYLYSIDKKSFTCVDAKNGEVVWEYGSEAADGMFHGFGMEKGPHDTPMFFTEKGLLLGTKEGLALVDPDTGALLAKSLYTGIPQSDGKYVALSSQKELLLLDMNLKLLWRKTGEYSAANVCIDGDYVFAARRGETSGAFHIIEAKTGKIIFSEDDSLFGISAMKVFVTKRYVIVSTMQGPWVYDKEKALAKGTSGQLSQTGLGVFESNEVNGKIYCATEEFGIVFNLETGIGDIIIPKDADKNKARMVSGHWLYTPNMYICMGLDATDEQKLKNQEGLWPKLFQIRNLDGSMVATVSLGTNKILKYGISASGSVIAISEIGEGAALKVYGP